MKKTFKRLVNTKNMDKETWLEYRLKGIGGSDAGIVMGVNPFRSVMELWEEKTGKKSISHAENRRQHFGHILEDVVRKEFERQTGFKVSLRNCIYQSIYNPYMIADVDGIVTEDDGSKAIFEAKTTSAFNREPWEKGDIPAHYVCQVQHYMSVLGLDKAYIACLVGGQDFYWYMIKRDDEFISNMIEREKAFWGNVLTGTKPDADGSKPTTEYLNSEYTKPAKDKVVLPDDAADIASQYLALDEGIKELKKEKDLMGNKLKVLMEDHEVGVAGDHIIRWGFYNRSALDTEKIKEELGERISEFTSTSSYRKFSVA